MERMVLWTWRGGDGGDNVSEDAVEGGYGGDIVD